MSPIPIKFPMVKEKTGYRRGPRFRRVVSSEGLRGAAFCAAGMVRLAQSCRRDTLVETDPIVARWRRTMVRLNAYWARVFAGHLPAIPVEIEIAERSAAAVMHAHFEAKRIEFEKRWPEIPAARLARAA